MIVQHREDGLAELEFRHAKELNPFSLAMTRQLVDLCAEVEADDEVAGVLLWGGAGRSFSAGGDFGDIRSLASEEEFAEYLSDIVRSYQALLRVTKPVVAAIDHYAIGQGLQVALMSDWRIGTDRSQYRMPELANGVPCPLGSTILDSMLGRAAMLHLVVGCPKLGAVEARAHRLIDEVCDHDQLRETARERLATFSRYPSLPFRRTKGIYNRRLIDELEEVRTLAAQAHAVSFFQGHANKHFSRILGDEG